MKKSIIFTLAFFIFNIISSAQSLALSNAPGSDPSGKSQRSIIEKTPWLDPTACASSVPGAASDTTAQKGKTYIIGDSITAGDTLVSSGIRSVLTNKGFVPVVINSKVSRKLSEGPSDLDGITVFKNDSSNWKDAKNIIIELGTNGVVNDANIKTMMKILSDANPQANVFWINVGANKPSRSAGTIDTASIDTTLNNNKSLGYKIIDWKSIADAHPDYISNDGYGVHPYTEAGSKSYTEAIASALSQNAGATVVNAIQSGCNCPAGVVNSGFKGNNNVETAFNFFNGRQGISTAQAAGIVGNFMRESGEKLDTGALNPDGSASFGIAQWLGGRKEGLINYARSQGKDATDITIQLEYVMIELNSPSYKDKVLVPLLKTTTPEEAAILWEDKFEVSNDVVGDAGMAKRINYANQVFALYGNNSPGSAPLSDCQNNPGSIGQAPDGFVFPLKTTKSAIKKGAGFVWCYTNLNNCHHDYPAADISVDTGTIVIASVGGKVIRADPSCTNTCSVTIKGTDQNVYFYQHMGSRTVTVKTGDVVSPAQELGKVGTKADADGTPPHLHFNIMNSKWDYMPTCFNSNCPNRADMINPQPWLISAYNNLPE